MLRAVRPAPGPAFSPAQRTHCCPGPAAPAAPACVRTCRRHRAVRQQRRWLSLHSEPLHSLLGRCALTHIPPLSWLSVISVMTRLHQPPYGSPGPICVYIFYPPFLSLFLEISLPLGFLLHLSLRLSLSLSTSLLRYIHPTALSSLHTSIFNFPPLSLSIPL